MKKSLIFLMLIIAFALGRADAQISVGITLSAHIAPPPLPVYDQPECPVDGYLWTPGYWSYGDNGYYWVPGVWVAPPQPGYLWTPGYWGYEGGIYAFHRGYWGPHVGFYGGVNYGFGYIGTGFVGGEWHGGTFRYNTAVMHVNRTVVHNTYINNTVIRNTTVNRVSFNGPGGIRATPRPQERAAMSEHHLQPTNQQQLHVQAARNDKSQYVNNNYGQPAHLAVKNVSSRSFNTTAAHPANMQSSFGKNASYQQRPQMPQQQHATAQEARPQMQPHQQAFRPQMPQHQQAPPRPQMPQHQQAFRPHQGGGFGRPAGGGGHQRHG